MCTVSWKFRHDGHDLFFSRDEQRTRPAAERPQRLESGGVPFLAPRDPKGGGTWIFSNAHGVTACLLNFYKAGIPAPPPTRSRGLLLRELAPAANLADLDIRVQAATAESSYAPCYVVALAPETKAGLWIWTGRELHRVRYPIRAPISTSSYDGDRILRKRGEEFDRLVAKHPLTPALLRRYHESPDRPADACSVRMSRPDARSVSLTHVSAGPANVVMSYAERDGDDGFGTRCNTSLRLFSTKPAPLTI